jgi:hypothetical protein
MKIYYYCLGIRFGNMHGVRDSSDMKTFYLEKIGKLKAS